MPQNFQYKIGKFSLTQQSDNFIMKCIITFCLLFVYFTYGQENPGFFLKVSKNVPRIGRRSENYENNFLKQTKSVPRIGRRSKIVSNSSV